MPYLSEKKTLIGGKKYGSKAEDQNQVEGL